jgi:hypothetical protein
LRQLRGASKVSEGAGDTAQASALLCGHIQHARDSFGLLALGGRPLGFVHRMHRFGGLGRAESAADHPHLSFVVVVTLWWRYRRQIYADMGEVRETTLT